MDSTAKTSDLDFVDLNPSLTITNCAAFGMLFQPLYASVSPSAKWG